MADRERERERERDSLTPRAGGWGELSLRDRFLPGVKAPRATVGAGGGKV